MDFLALITVCYGLFQLKTEVIPLLCINSKASFPHCTKPDYRRDPFGHIDQIFCPMEICPQAIQCNKYSTLFSPHIPEIIAKPLIIIFAVFL